MTEAVERTELVLPGPAEALAGALGVAQPDLGDGLPPLWHWIYLLDRPAQTDLGPDGHPVRGTLPLPPGPGLRRMWAGGQVRVLDRLAVGEAATRHTSVLDTQRKTGRSGELIFVTVGHRISQGGRLVVDERQDLVYRKPSDAGAEPAAPAPVADAPSGWRVPTSPTLLFRFSALTYNSHRIHYDRDYARDIEGYPGLLVHGPLQALCMAEAVRALRLPRPAGLVFDYRLRAPLFDHQGMVVTASGTGAAAEAAVRDDSGRTTASATVTQLD